MEINDRPWFVRYSVFAMRAAAVLGLSGLILGIPAVPFAAGWLLLWLTIDLTPLTTYLMNALADKRAAKACLRAIELADVAIRGTSELLCWMFDVFVKSALYAILAIVMFYAGGYAFKYFTGYK